MAEISQRWLLETIFKKVFQKPFFSQDIDDRVMLQKTIFLLREAGISCGEYDFVWDQYGPFSPELSDDMKQPEPEEQPEIRFSEYAEKWMAKLGELFGNLNGSEGYSVRYWTEAVASLYYLKTYVYPSYSDEQLVKALEQKKNTMHNHQENIRALQAVKQNFA